MTIINFKIKFYKENKNNIPNKYIIYKYINNILNFKKLNLEILILIVNKKKIKYLNKIYKNKNYYTNVLTFVSPKILIFNRFITYCDIIICKKIIEKESKIYKKNLFLYWIHIIIHSCLHIIGYKHDNLLEFNNMKKKEIKILNRLNFLNFYK